MKKLLRQFWLLFQLIATTIFTTQAQVTIGCEQTPISGALLDLKEENSTSKGLGLPRVKLTKLNPDSDSDFAASIGGSGSWNRAQHEGLLIYNVNDTPAGCTNEIYVEAPAQGIYVWDGSAWSRIPNTDNNGETKDVRTIVDHGMTGKVGTFTMSYTDASNNTENETYYYADFADAGIWMTQNLRTKYAPDGTALKNSAAYSDIGRGKYNYAYISRTSPTSSTDYDANVAAGKQIGLLYDWYTATDSKNCSQQRQTQVGYLSDNPATPGEDEVESKEVSGRIKGICPTGWHLPSDREWNALEKELVTHASLYTETPTADGAWTDSWETATNGRGTINGRVMKSRTLIQYATNLIRMDSKSYLNGGFDAYATGCASTNSGGSPFNYGSQSYFWSSSAHGNSGAWTRYFLAGNEMLYRNPASTTDFIVSVRCKKD